MSLELSGVNSSEMAVNVGRLHDNSHCLVLVDTDEPHHHVVTDVDISKEVEFWITMTVSAGLIPLLSCLGIPGNILSAAVFYRQGLQERINVCLFALALADLVVVVSLFLHYSENVYRQFVGPSWVMATNLPGIEGTIWASQLLSAVIASERCFCVVSPFHAKRLLKTSTMAAVIVVGCVVLIGGRCVVAGPKHTSTCVFYPATNLTEEILSVTTYYMQNKAVLDFIDLFIYTLALPIAFLVVIILTTSVTTIKLRATLAWRQTATSTATRTVTTANTDDRMSSKEVSLTLMLIVTSVIFVICLTPNIVFQIAIFIEPNLGHGGLYHRLNAELWSVVSFLMVFHSCINFIVYFKMGSTFREIVKSLLMCQKLKGPNLGRSSKVC